MKTVWFQKFKSAVRDKFCELLCDSRITTPLADLEEFPYRLALPPENAKLEAWDKLKECERRLSVYKWAETLNDPRQPRYRVFLNDCVNAILLTIEATLQFVGKAFEQEGRPKSDFREWLGSLSEYDVCLRGLRTLRHFAAHVEVKLVPSLVRCDLGGETTATREWQLPRLNSTDLAKLTTRPLPEEMLSDWNNLVSQTPALVLFERAVRQTACILTKAESQLN